MCVINKWKMQSCGTARNASCICMEPATGLTDIYTERLWCGNPLQTTNHKVSAVLYLGLSSKYGCYRNHHEEV